ncbi:hypothetical protein R1flu_018386 [Riccia fluitans]|uniref:Uncharacterized protein n=1 Tax=Riccia fluitans TaxID=41844 RepID=A0ABD1ZFP6_9MARC
MDVKCECCVRLHIEKFKVLSNSLPNHQAFCDFCTAATSYLRPSNVVKAFLDDYILWAPCTDGTRASARN